MGDWLVLAGSACILILAAVLEVNANQRVVVPLLQLEIPELCLWRRLANMHCPGCGLTRGFIHLMHGDFASAWRTNAAGWLVFLAVSVQIPYRIAQLRRDHQGQACWDVSRLIGWLWLLPIALLGQWWMRTFLG